MAALKRIVPKAAIGVVLRKTGRGKAPCRLLPRWFVVWFVIVMALFCRDSYQPVFRWLHRFRKGITPGRSTLCEAWQSVGVAPLRLLAEQLIELQAKPDTRQAFYGGLRLMGVDSFVVDVPDTPENVRVDQPKDCVRWVKSGTGGLTRNKFLRIRPQAWGLAAGDIFRRAQSTRFLIDGARRKCPPPPQKDFDVLEQARASLLEYIEVFYNRERRHSALGYVSPLAFEEAA